MHPIINEVIFMQRNNFFQLALGDEIKGSLIITDCLWSQGKNQQIAQWS